MYSRDYDLVINKTIKLSKQSELKLVFPEEVTPDMYFLNNHEQIDSVKECRRKLLEYYIIGEKGYYVISRLTGKISSYQNYDLIPSKYKRNFDIIAVEKE